MTLKHSATVRHRRLATELRKLRELRGLKSEQAAQMLGWSPSNLSKAETAARKPSKADVSAMLDLYGCDDKLRNDLMKLTEDLTRRGWWVDYTDVIEPSFAELEEEAAELRTYQRDNVPGLLQIDEYALALIKEASIGSKDRAEIGRRLTARGKRRERLYREDAPVFHAVIEESVLRTPIGGRDVQNRQLQALLDASQQPNIKIQVMPLEVWQHPGHEGSFMIMGFGATSFGVIYVEGAMGHSGYLEDAQKLERSRLAFARISEAALTESGSKALIEGLLAA